jgi:hypothetical protein
MRNWNSFSLPFRSPKLAYNIATSASAVNSRTNMYRTDISQVILASIGNSHVVRVRSASLIKEASRVCFGFEDFSNRNVLNG